MRKFATFLLSAALATAACAQSEAKAQPRSAPPRLLIVISVDQFSADLFDEYRPQFTGGLARLAQGTAFRNGYQAHAATETCPGHSTILTGSHPAHTGIIANNLIDQSAARAKKQVYCAEDERLSPPQGQDYIVSPAHLRVATLGDILKERSPESLNVAVAGKDRAAIMMGGHKVDQRWYWDGAKFTTDTAAARMPTTVARANQAVAASIARAGEGLTPPPFCQAKAAPVRVSDTLTVGNGRFVRTAGDAKAFRASPEIDGAVLAIAAGLVQELGLGADPSPDILSIGLSATDYVGHSYGPGGQEMCLQLLSLDRDLGDFFRLLDSRGLDYAVILTADHGGLDIPERLRAKGIAQAQRADSALATNIVGRAIGAKLKLPGPVLLGDFAGDVYIDRSLSAGNRARVEAEALAFYRSHPQVYAAYTAAQIERNPLPTGRADRWTVEQRVRASFDRKRSGDLYVVLKPYVMPIATPGAGYVATHGSPWDYDRRVPILFWRSGMPPANRGDAVATVDILPTAEGLLGLAVPAQTDGKCLPAIAGIACSAR
jgi:predicted AlkP superfamily pyrophosphatase or phosphodiesterase